MEGAGISVGGTACRGKTSLQLLVDSLQVEREAIQDAGYRMHEGNENPKFEARNQKKFK